MTRSSPDRRADLAVLVALNAQKAMDTPQGPSMLHYPLISGHEMWAVRPMIQPGREEMLASGSCELRAWLPKGDGSFTKARVPMHLSGWANKRGTNLLVGAVAASMAYNAVGSHAARRSTKPRWQDLARGRLAVSTHGIYIEDQQAGLQSFAFDEITSMERQRQSVFAFTADEGDRSVKYELTSEWAELAFVWWVHASFPNHPRKYVWFDQDWVQRITQVLHVDPLSVPAQREVGLL